MSFLSSNKTTLKFFIIPYKGEICNDLITFANL